MAWELMFNNEILGSLGLQIPLESAPIQLRDRCLFLEA